MRDYFMATPSLDGILSHSSIAYDGVVRPEKIIRLFERPHIPSEEELSYSENIEIVKAYLADVHALFMRIMGQYIVEHDSAPDREVKLTALLQEIIKMKRIIRDHPTIEL